MAELNKLPSKFLLPDVVPGEGPVLEVTQVERRRAISRPSWLIVKRHVPLSALGFQELEVAIRHLSGVNLRTELNITWFESNGSRASNDCCSIDAVGTS